MAWLRHGSGPRAQPFGLELTEQDPALAIRGYVISRTGVLPTDPSFRELSCNDELLRYTAYWLQRREEDFYRQICHILGVLWTRQDVKAMSAEKKTAALPNETFIPLAIGINPELVKGLQKMFRVGSDKFIGGGEYVPAAGERVVELGDLPKEEYLQFVNSATDTMREVAKDLTERQRLVTVKEGDPEDPRMQRALEQIAHSKRFK